MYYHMQFHQLKYTSSSEQYQPAFDKYQNGDDPEITAVFAIWICILDS